MNKKNVESVHIHPMAHHTFGLVFKYKIETVDGTAPINLTKNPAIKGGQRLLKEQAVAMGIAEEHCILSGISYFDLVEMRNTIDTFLRTHGASKDAVKTTMEVKKDD